MNKEDIIRMAEEAGGFLGEVPRGDAWMFAKDEYLERFAALVASAEREACAKLCDDLDDDIVDGLAGWQYAEAIRARGQA